ncbi:hypothetical protein VSX62_06385 [Aurantimonas sp. C2-3-R2]|nr:hypothetical protein [Aurantimonas sp. C2-3-R2]
MEKIAAQRDDLFEQGRLQLGRDSHGLRALFLGERRLLKLPDIELNNAAEVNDSQHDHQKAGNKLPADFHIRDAHSVSFIQCWIPAGARGSHEKPGVYTVKSPLYSGGGSHCHRILPTVFLAGIPDHRQKCLRIRSYPRAQSLFGQQFATKINSCRT